MLNQQVLSFEVDYRNLYQNLIELYREVKQDDLIKQYLDKGNEDVIELLKKAWKWSEKIENDITIKEISEQEKVSISYVSKVLKLRFLSPRIQKMILLGEQSEKLTSHNLRMVMSMDFKEQEKQLGIL